MESMRDLNKNDGVEQVEQDDAKTKLSTIASPSTVDPPVKTIHEVYSPELAKAMASATPMNALSGRSFKLYFIMMVGFLNAVSSGFDGSLMSGINAMDQYLDFFGYTTTGASTGVIFMIYVAGNCVGSLFAGPFCDLWGRRGAMFVGGFFILLGSAVVTSAQTAEAFIGGRFVLGFGIAISTTAAPTWVTELAPPTWRGRLGAFYNSCFFIGSIPATGAMVGTNKMNSTWAWRLPLILQIGPPIIVMSCVWFCPESPRYLVAQGKREEALAVLVKHHTSDGKINALIELEMKEIEESVTVKRQTPWWDYSALFKTRNARWRILCLALMCINGQLAGNGLITYFLPVVLSNAGVTSSQRQLVFNFANSILSAFGAFLGASVTDRIGRRRRLYVGAFVLACLLATVAAMSSKYGVKGNTNTAGANASIAFILLFGVAYSFTYTPLQALYCAEVMNNDTRARGMGIHILISNIAGFINTFANSVGLGKLGWKYYFVFVAWNLVACGLWYFFCVETRGRTLEELEDVFNQPWPAWSSKRTVKVEVKETGDVEVIETI
ncbi:general substrate transporter [Stereum hirsutum FP-91666 SS1]|uniref:general substrate transporter n=1 Tax=Stereum hirsutum (strain FP-91666) TaxID=721885 RepID=UPI000444A886|nr:general substrate transporter [Stereum hirsutum FP-91666 SS1]EIM81448.1 general substrate transporter [Stereum hirsutum FP-91666 SS1]